MKTYHLTAVKGRYSLLLSPTEKDTYVHVYVSTEKGGPQALQNSNQQEIKLFKRQRRKRLTARWDPRYDMKRTFLFCGIRTKY